MNRIIEMINTVLGWISGLNSIDALVAIMLLLTVIVAWLVFTSSPINLDDYDFVKENEND